MRARQGGGGLKTEVFGLPTGRAAIPSSNVPARRIEQARSPAVAARRNAGSPIYVCFADAGVGAGVPLGRLAAGQRACRAGSWSSTGRAG